LQNKTKNKTLGIFTSIFLLDSNMNKGIVIKSTGSWYQVRTLDGEVLECRIIGKFRLDGLNLTNPVAVGDEVEYVYEGSGGLIKKILPRNNYVARQSPRQKHNIHLLASNIDQAVLIVTIVEPKVKPGFIDRFLIMTEPYDIPTTIVFNKADIYGEGAMELFEEMRQVYEKVGYQILLTSATQNIGIEAFKNLLKDKVSLIGGQSGVGKSSLVNAIQPQLELRTGEISDYSGKGQHTTTFAEMHQLSFGGSLIDTPGIKTLAFNNLEPQQVTQNFRELFQYSENCRFSNCTHRNEPQCAIKEAVVKGNISEMRYANYLQILEEVEDQNYWERHTDI
jgi:ribosome biogenesis GTPase / thiamine phosphate phosphatase